MATCSTSKVWMVLLLAFVSSCALGDVDNNNVEILRRLIQPEADPVRDANRLIAQGDCRLLGIQGYAVTIPGIERGISVEYVQLYEVNIVKGTSDVFGGDDFGWEHLSLQQKAVEYAKNYNWTIQAAIEKGNCKKHETGK